MRRVVLHIDRLVLRGIERTGAAGLVAGLEDGLRSSLGADAAVSSLVAQRSLPAASTDHALVIHGAGTASIGRVVAHRILGGGNA